MGIPLPMIDWSLNVGNLIQIVAMVAGGLAVFLTMRGDIRVLWHDVRRLEQGQEALSEAFRQLGQILTQVAVQDSRLQMLEKNIDELRHGAGYVVKK